MYNNQFNGYLCLFVFSSLHHFKDIVLKTTTVTIAWESRRFLTLIHLYLTQDIWVANWLLLAYREIFCKKYPPWISGPSTLMRSVVVFSPIFHSDTIENAHRFYRKRIHLKTLFKEETFQNETPIVSVDDRQRRITVDGPSDFGFSGNECATRHLFS